MKIVELGPGIKYENLGYNKGDNLEVTFINREKNIKYNKKVIKSCTVISENTTNLTLHNGLYPENIHKLAIIQGEVTIRRMKDNGQALGKKTNTN